MFVTSHSSFIKNKALQQVYQNSMESDFYYYWNNVAHEIHWVDHNFKNFNVWKSCKIFEKIIIKTTATTNRATTKKTDDATINAFFLNDILLNHLTGFNFSNLFSFCSGLSLSRSSKFIGSSLFFFYREIKK